MDDAGIDPFWAMAPSEALAAIGASAAGLTEAEAQLRLARFGPNRAVLPGHRRLPMRLLRRLIEPLIAILIVAALLSGVTGDVASMLIILAILGFSIGLDVFQEGRAQAAAEALRHSVAIEARVLRNGAPRAIPTEALVPGDVVLLRAGDLVPADGVVLCGADAHAQEALLTGEPYPVEKRPGPAQAHGPAEAFSALFAGTAMISGEARMLVTATGAETRFGAIAAALEGDAPPTAYQIGLHRLGVLILRLTGFLVLFVLLTHLAFGRPALESFLFAIALAVGLTPELLPMITTVTLSRGAQRMARRRVVVKRLPAIHDLGAMDVFCTDKTGTLTEARISLARHIGPDGADSPRVLELAAVNSRFESGVKSPLDDAILAAAEAMPFPGWLRIADIPFDFERRRVSVLAQHDGRRLLVVKGAPEELLARASRMEGPDGPVPLDPARRAALVAQQDALAGQGLRCLGVAWRDMPQDQDRPDPGDESALVWAGLCAFEDPPKPSAAAAIARLGAAGVQVKIISGDAAPVLRHLISALGIPARGLLTGEEMQALDDDALSARVEGTDLFARVSPDQKARVIRALQARGHTVGFLGDGINDAPAIRQADCGMSVADASDVARAAADLILLEQDLGVVADGVAEGRRTDANITKYIRMGTSSNFGNMLSMAAASLFIPFLPLTPVQVLLNNLLYDVSETGIPFDSVDEADIAAPHGWDMAAILRFTLVMGPLSSVFDIATFAILRLGFDASPEVFRTAWFVESMATQVLVVFVIRTGGPAWRSLPHRGLVLSSLGALALALVVALSPLGALIGFAPLPGALLGLIAALVLAYLALAEGLKRRALRKPGRALRSPG
ncbi:magnesium-translocating P-type ATPase [Sediminicoccus sp. KRV36]|uniref:magnesium-translocating P-type ATPase n=1 Tax=Sediminicoccus sp. KRV36 TaxID=3133721 RepID=UPI00200EF67B|nr:magnesium-translocating P-type ATPase [Sediminicoccus rosea]UPY36582.1 magnesium-translocating P-type ATPase [Sediminicoccus rosea]